MEEMARRDNQSEQSESEESKQSEKGERSEQSERATALNGLPIVATHTSRRHLTGPGPRPGRRRLVLVLLPLLVPPPRHPPERETVNSMIDHGRRAGCRRWWGLASGVSEVSYFEL
jgi:hypothetical protein